tara:strand:+ start:376 stop:819 length:444 start_codon:yes stop_codon:yes gene_type:complete
MPEEFIMRGQTASGQIETLNFSGYKPGYAYRLVEFVLFPSTNYLASSYEMCGTVTAAKTAVTPTDPNFNEQGLIGTAFCSDQDAAHYPASTLSVVDDTFLITQNLLLMVQESNNQPINWQCRFIKEKMSGSEEAVANYKQFTISDGS